MATHFIRCGLIFIDKILQTVVYNCNGADWWFTVRQIYFMRDERVSCTILLKATGTWQNSHYNSIDTMFSFSALLPALLS
jgi:hypothetical protein